MAARSTAAVDAARAISLARIHAASRALAARPPKDTDVHRARQELTRARTVLQLLRFALEPEVYETVNRSLRDASRHLAAARDAAVLAQLLRATLARAGLAPRPVRPLLAQLRAERRARRAAIDPRYAARLLVVADAALRSSAPTGTESRLHAGFRRIYRRGRRAYRAARAHDDEPALLHEWRKDAKRLRHCLETLAPGWPHALGPLARNAKRLADALGLHHDTTLLIARVRSGALPESARTRLHAELLGRRSKLRREALALGKRLYGSKPKRLALESAQWRCWAGTSATHGRSPRG
jgi:CHAD domain-containing protein